MEKFHKRSTHAYEDSAGNDVRSLRWWRRWEVSRRTGRWVVVVVVVVGLVGLVVVVVVMISFFLRLLISFSLSFYFSYVVEYEIDHQ